MLSPFIQGFHAPVFLLSCDANKSCKSVLSPNGYKWQKDTISVCVPTFHFWPILLEVCLYRVTVIRGRPEANYFGFNSHRGMHNDSTPGTSPQEGSKPSRWSFECVMSGLCIQTRLARTQLRSQSLDPLQTVVLIS